MADRNLISRFLLYKKRKLPEKQKLPFRERLILLIRPCKMRKNPFQNQFRQMQYFFGQFQPFPVRPDSDPGHPCIHFQVHGRFPAKPLGGFRQLSCHIRPEYCQPDIMCNHFLIKIGKNITQNQNRLVNTAFSQNQGFLRRCRGKAIHIVQGFQFPCYGNRSMPIAVGFHHAHDSGARCNVFLHLFHVIAYGIQIHCRIYSFIFLRNIFLFHAPTHPIFL